MNYMLEEYDYEAFYNRKADWHEELNNVKDTTKYKLKQVTFRILRQVGIVSEENMIIQAILSPRLVELLKPDAPESYQIFPVLDIDI